MKIQSVQYNGYFKFSIEPTIAISVDKLDTGVDVTDEATAQLAAQVLVSHGVERVVITMGSAGAYLYEEGKGVLIPACKVSAVDTTAAGDVYNGALCAALAEGQSLQDALKFATKASAISVTRVGAQPSVPTREEVDNF